MKTNFELANEYYHRILEEPAIEARRKLYLDLLVSPWKAMMDLNRRSWKRRAG